MSKLETLKCVVCGEVKTLPNFIIVYPSGKFKYIPFCKECRSILNLKS